MKKEKKRANDIYIYIYIYGDAPEFWAKKSHFFVPNTGSTPFLVRKIRAPKFGRTDFFYKKKPFFFGIVSVHLRRKYTMRQQISPLGSFFP